MATEIGLNGHDAMSFFCSLMSETWCSAVMGILFVDTVSAFDGTVIGTVIGT